MIEDLLTFSVQKNASDLHITSGLKPRIRINGNLKILDEIGALNAKATLAMLECCMDEHTRKQLAEDRDVDFALDIKGVGRFRVNAYYDHQGVAAAFRVIPQHIPTLEALHLPEVIRTLLTLPRGLVLITGPTGSGKSTTLAAMINAINQEQDAHIITIEDPIEFIHSSQKSLIHQRELNNSTPSFAHALKAALRQDPDIILLGEMRDLETIRLALTAAETGHLVFATLHTSSAPESIHRMIDVFPSEEKSLVRSMLSESLQAIVAQTLVPKKGGGRIAAMEIMLVNAAIRNLIREDKIPHMLSIIQTNAAQGMQTVEQHLKLLKKQNLVAE